MGRRVLRISAELVADWCKAFTGPTYHFRVVKDALPADARVVSVTGSPGRPNTVEVVLESAAWPAAGDGAEVRPACEAVPSGDDRG
jgi:hypothetical protein